MTPLRQKMEADLRLRNLADSTQRQYLWCIAAYARHFGRSPDKLGADEVRAFLLHLVALGRASATRVVYHAALLFLYVQTLGRPEVMATVPRPRVRTTDPRRPLTREEVAALLEAAVPSPFTYTLVATLLATGLRVSEACRLQIDDIDSRSGMIHVRQGKGSKPRSVKLGDRHLRLLRRYWVVERPQGPWLFPAQRLVAPGVVDPEHRWAPRPVSTDVVRNRLDALTRRAGLQWRVKPHDLRRTYGLAVAKTAGILVASKLLRHHDPRITAKVYAPLGVEDLRTAAEEVGGGKVLPMKRP